MTVLSPAPLLDTPLIGFDPEVAGLLGLELARQREGLEMTASENLAPRAVMQAPGGDAECLALARAVRWHGQHRILLHGPRTVVFS
jgi:Serine hydroxymethyltransferase